MRTLRASFRNRNVRSAVWILLCFSLTSGVYLTWLYHLVDLVGGTWADRISMIAGYLLQAAGTGLVMYGIAKWGEGICRRFFAPSAVLLIAMCIPAAGSRSAQVVIVSGLAVNLLCGVIAGCYLYALFSYTGAKRRGTVFGFGYGLSSVLIFLLSSPGEDSFLKKLAACRSRSTHNIVALTSSVDASENDVYFRNPAYELNATAEAAEPFFFNEKLFPQMVSKFSNGFSSTPKLVHTYDALQEVFADRMLVLNDLSYEKLRTAVKYIFMRRSGGSFYYSPDLYAAVIWAWYENPGFRDKYAFLRLPANPFRSMRIITDYIGRYNITGIADVIIRQEQAWQVREFLARWQCAEKCPSIIYENNDAQDNHCSAIIEMMIAYKKTMKRHEAILGDAGAAQMNRVMLFFSNPSYTSCYNKVKLPHERFAEEENKTAITQMLGKLREKTEWNSWEEGAMLLLYTLFEQCYRQSKAMCSIDQYNELGKSVFEKALQAMQYCMYRAEDVYGSMDELKLAAKRANQFVMEAQSVLSSGNNKKIRDYVILKGVS